MKNYDRYIDARIAVLRKDWDPSTFGDRLSFYSFDESPFCHGDEIAPDGMYDSLQVKLAKDDHTVACTIVRHDGERFYRQFADNDQEALTQSFLSWMSNEMTFAISDEDLRSDIAFLIYHNGTQDVAADGDWAHTCDGHWLGKVGDGEEIGPVDSSFAGGVLLEVVSGENIPAVIEDEMIWPKSESGDDLDISDFADENSRFIGVGK